MPKFKYIFGPVYSWRLGYSLGIDPLSGRKKICNYNCTYCQLGPTRCPSCRRGIFVAVRDIAKEIWRLPPVPIDYITFSGRGEPTLAGNLGAMIRSVRRIRPEKIAVITNGSLLYQKGVRKDLALADFVLVKMDAWDPLSWQEINRPASGGGFERMLAGIKTFRRYYKGYFGLQIMLIERNLSGTSNLVRFARDLHPDEIQLNTPLRKSPVKPLSVALMRRFARFFTGSKIRMVYQARRKKSTPLNAAATRRRHGTEDR